MLNMYLSARGAGLAVIVLHVHVVLSDQSQDVQTDTQYASWSREITDTGTIDHREGRQLPYATKDVKYTGTIDHREGRQLPYATKAVKDTGSIDYREGRQLPYATKAVKALIAKSKKASITGNTVYYMRQGNLQTAVDDFYDLKPRDIRKPTRGYYATKGKVLFGRIDTYKVRVMEKGSTNGRYPVLEFTNSPTTYRVIYKTEDRRLTDELQI